MAGSTTSTACASNEVDKMSIVLTFSDEMAAELLKDSSSTAEEDGKVGWDCHAAKFPGEDDDEEETDSGYASSGDAPSKPLTKYETDAITYHQLPFIKKHYLLTYIQRILEETCVRYARRYYSAYFTDPKWRMKHLQFPPKELQEDRFVNRDWLAEDQIELKIWMTTFRERIDGNRKNNSIFKAVENLRDAAVHRGILKDSVGNSIHFTFGDLSEAMRLPYLLKDSKTDSEISNAFRCIMEDPTLDEEIRSATEIEIFTPLPCRTYYQFLARIQNMLEETCFNTAARKIPGVLKQNDWHCYEQLEITKYYDLFCWKNGIQPQTDIFPGVTSFRDLLSGVREFIRNVAHHRLTPPVRGSLTQHGMFIKYIHEAITLCILQGDWNQAIEIEILAEMYLTKTSRTQVLERLEAVYRVGCIETLYERKRRVELTAFFARMEGRELCEGDAVVLSDTQDVVGKPDPEASWDHKTWSLSMHGELMNLEEVEMGCSWEDEEQGGSWEEEEAEQGSSWIE